MKETLKLQRESNLTLKFLAESQARMALAMAALAASVSENDDSKVQSVLEKMNGLHVSYDASETLPQEENQLMTRPSQ